MILDPYGDVIAECRELDNAIAVATLTPENWKERAVTDISKPVVLNFTGSGS